MASWYLWSLKKYKLLVWLLWIIIVLHLEYSDRFKYPLIVILYLYLKQKENTHPSSWDELQPFMCPRLHFQGGVVQQCSPALLKNNAGHIVKLPMNCLPQYDCIVYIDFISGLLVRGLGHKRAGVTSDKHSRLTAVEITILNWAQCPMDRANSAEAGLWIQGCCQHWRMESSAWDA